MHSRMPVEHELEQIDIVDVAILIVVFDCAVGFILAAQVPLEHEIEQVHIVCVVARINIALSRFRDSAAFRGSRDRGSVVILQNHTFKAQ